MNTDINTLIEQSNEIELKSILDILSTEKFAEILAEEILKSGSIQLTSENIRNIVAALDDDAVPSDILAETSSPASRTSFTISEWLNYWFGHDGGSKSKENKNNESIGNSLTETGVFFNESKKIFDSLTDFINNFSNSIDATTSESDARKQDIEKFIASVDALKTNPTEARKNIQNFIDTYSGSYVTSKEGDLLKQFKNETEVLAIKDPYGVGAVESSSKNKELYEKQNELIRSKVGPLFKDLVKKINEELLRLKDEISSDYIYNAAKSIQQSGMKNLGGSSSGRTPEAINPEDTAAIGKGGNTLIVGLIHLLEDAKAGMDLYPALSKEDDTYIQKQHDYLSTVNKSLKESNKELTALKTTNEKNYALLAKLEPFYDEAASKIKDQQYVAAAEFARSQVMDLSAYGLAEDPESQARQDYDNYKLILDDYNKNFNIVKNYDAAAKGIKDTEAAIIKLESDIEYNTDKKVHIEEQVRRNLENYGEYSFSKKTYESTLKKLNRAETKVKEYRAILEIMTETSINDFVSDNEVDALIDRVVQQKPIEWLREAIAAINEFVPNKFKVEPAKEIPADFFRLVYDENANEEELLSEQDIYLLKDQFLHALDTYDAKEKQILAIKNKILSKLQDQFVTIGSKYEQVRSKIVSNVSSFASSAFDDFGYKLDAKVKDLDKITDYYDSKISVLDSFKENIGKLDNFDANTVYEQIDKKDRSDDKVRDVAKYVSLSLDILNRYKASLVESRSTKLKYQIDQVNTLKKYGIDPGLIESAFEDIKNFAEPSEVNQSGLDNLNQLVSKLKSIDKADYNYIISPEYGISNVSEQLVGTLSKCSDVLKKYSPTRLNHQKSGAVVFTEALKQLLTSNFVDLDKYKEMITLAQKSDILKDVIQLPVVSRYSQDITNRTALRDAKINKIVSSGINSELKSLNTLIYNSIKNLKAEGKAFNNEFFGNTSIVESSKEELEKINQTMERLEKILLEKEKEFNEATDEEQKLEARNSLEKSLNIYDENKAKIENLESTIEKFKGVKEPKTYENFIDKVLFPQKTMISRAFNDPRDPRAGDWFESKPSMQSVGNKNFQSILDSWKKLINQCEKSISGATESKDHKYMSDEDQYSPVYNEKGILNKEISLLSKNGTPENLKKIDLLKNIESRISLKPEDTVDNSINYYKSSPANESKNILEKLIKIREKLTNTKTLMVNGKPQVMLDKIPLTKEEKDFLNEVKFTPEERNLINEVKEKWESEFGVFQTKTLREYEAILRELINKIYTDDSELRERNIRIRKQNENFANNSEYVNNEKIRASLQERNRILNFYVFQLKFAPTSISEEEASKIQNIVEESIKEIEKLNDQARGTLNTGGPKKEPIVNPRNYDKLIEKKNEEKQIEEIEKNAPSLHKDLTSIIIDIGKEDGIFDKNGKEITKNLSSSQEEKLAQIERFLNMANQIESKLANIYTNKKNYDDLRHKLESKDSINKKIEQLTELKDVKIRNDYKQIAESNVNDTDAYKSYVKNIPLNKEAKKEFDSEFNSAIKEEFARRKELGLKPLDMNDVLVARNEELKIFLKNKNLDYSLFANWEKNDRTYSKFYEWFLKEFQKVLQSEQDKRLKAFKERGESFKSKESFRLTIPEVQQLKEDYLNKALTKYNLNPILFKTWEIDKTKEEIKKLQSEIDEYNKKVNLIKSYEDRRVFLDTNDLKLFNSCLEFISSSTKPATIDNDSPGEYSEELLTRILELQEKSRYNPEMES